ncbi:GAF domain-containing sensor histidine kinase [Aliiglaciecola sp. CAU 1673]|uniref:GAF domain-containing sensor histidine kinase n=1 Tax=Aliiglaciecola sp. CAU 1673 TaxID=3032595 RepID=UPI0023DA23C1|nr:GAF domain-containing sensor histidine kinase [Aliiglaciecola sp. CAU 1673]MDF2179483.1 GAF domain-containing sensor histidine kinase [Aliiglaciecola sp. CAU 1673]
MQAVLTELVSALESIDDDLKCSIMLLGEADNKLYSLVGPNLPENYSMAISGVDIGPTVGSCGASAYLKQPVIVADIQTHPNWQPYRAICEQHQLRACWSHPIFSANKKVLGTFGMYYSSVREPSPQERSLIAMEANIAGMIMERMLAEKSQETARQSLEREVQRRTQELTQSNTRLREALQQRNEVQQQLLEIENLSALGTMTASLTHEINTPIGVAVTALSHLQNLHDKGQKQFEANQLTRSALLQFYRESAEAMAILERNLQRSAELVSTFKQLSLDQHTQHKRLFNLCDYLWEILLSLKPKLKQYRLMFCLDVDADLEINSYPGAISQILVNLIINSMHHGYQEGQKGRITIRVSQQQQELVMEYADDGKGMNAETIERMFEPFYTSARDKGGSGLGMHICKDLVEKLLHGTIACTAEPDNGCQICLKMPLINSDGSK